MTDAPFLAPFDEPPVVARTETAQRVIEHAKRILRECELGYSHSDEKRGWARSILGTAKMWGKA